MTEETVAAPAAPEPVAVPDAQAEATPTPKDFEPTPRGAIDRAFDAVDKVLSNGDDDEPGGPERDESGRFKAKEGAEPAKEVKPEMAKAEKQQPKTEPETKNVKAEKPEEAQPGEDQPKPVETKFKEPPARFSPDAKAAWETAPEPVKAEIHRAVKELETGIEKYRTEFEPLREYSELAKEHKTTIKQALDNYISLERKLHSDPIAGIKDVFDYVGISPNDFAAHILGQQANPNASQTDAVARQLRQEIAELKQQLTGVVETTKTQSEQQMLREIETWAADKPRFDDLAQDIAFFIQSGRANDLQEAYDLAERLNPSPVMMPPVEAAHAAPQPNPAAQTRKGSLSLTGAPGPGSNPANRKPPSSPREALDASFASLGLG